MIKKSVEGSGTCWTLPSFLSGSKLLVLLPLQSIYGLLNKREVKTAGY